VQALSLSRDLKKLFQELHRVLKPGAKISLSEWVRLANFDEKNAHHVMLLRRIKPLVGAIGTPSVEEYESALREAGFEVLLSVDPSVNKSQEILVDKAGGYYDKLLPFMNFLVKIKILPKHFITLFDRLGKNTEALCEADRLGLVAMSYQFVAQKI
jgi:sterol 24-C-methyltransferase